MSAQVQLFGGVVFSPNVPNPENVRRLDHGALPMIAAMHRHGIRLDIPYIQALNVRIVDLQRGYESEARSWLGRYQYRHAKHGYIPFNIGSRDHLAQLFFEELRIQGDGVELKRTPTGKREEVSAEILEPYRDRHPAVGPVIEWHSCEKLRNTYTSVLPGLVDSESRLHTKFNVTVASTGRLSSSNPNLQNIPIRTKLGKEIRGAFVCSPGRVLVSADMAQIEMVWAAHRSQDPVMLSVFRNRQDIHTRTTCEVFGLDYEKCADLTRRYEAKQTNEEESAAYLYFKQFQRLPCKTVGFGVLYGQTAEGLQKSLASEGIHWTLEQCEKFITQDFFAVYGGLRVMLEDDYSFARRYGMVVDYFGRVRLVPEAKSNLKWINNEGTRKAGNHPEQSSAQGGLKLSMAELQPICERMDVWPLLQIHDQLISDCPVGLAQEFADVKTWVMEHSVPLSVPTRASNDIGERWMDL